MKALLPVIVFLFVISTAHIISMEQPPLLAERGLIELPKEFNGKPVYYLHTPCIKGISCGYYTLNNAIQLERRLKGQIAEPVEEFVNTCMRNLSSGKKLIEGTTYEQNRRIAHAYSLAPLVQLDTLKSAGGTDVIISRDYRAIVDPKGKSAREYDLYNFANLEGIRNAFIEGYYDVIHFSGFLTVGDQNHVILLSVVRQSDGTSGLYVFDNCNMSPEEHATLYLYIHYLLNNFISNSWVELPQILSGAIKNRNLSLLGYLLKMPEVIDLIKNPKNNYLKLATDRIHFNFNNQYEVIQMLLAHGIFVPEEALRYFNLEEADCTSKQMQSIFSALLKMGANPFYEYSLNKTVIENLFESQNNACISFFNSQLDAAQKEKVAALKNTSKRTFTFKELLQKGIIKDYMWDFNKLPINSLEGLASLSYPKKNINKLSFTDNSLSSLPANAFKGYTNLENLIISSNPLTSIDPEAFAGLPNLENLVLSTNKLTWLDPLVLQNILDSQKIYSTPALRLVDVRGNQLTTNNIEAIQRILPPKVKFLFDEPKEDVKPVPTKTLSPVPEEPSLTQKKAYGYSIKELINNKTIDPQPIETYLSNRLKPSSTKINSLDGLQLFKNKKHYTDISFNDNNISKLSQKDFEGFIQITQLDLSDNKISSIELGTFQSMPLLEEIQLKNNNLTAFDPHLIEGLSQLKSLDLSGNALSQDNITSIKNALAQNAQLII